MSFLHLKFTYSQMHKSKLHKLLIWQNNTPVYTKPLWRHFHHPRRFPLIFSQLSRGNHCSNFFSPELIYFVCMNGIICVSVWLLSLSMVSVKPRQHYTLCKSAFIHPCCWIVHLFSTLLLNSIPWHKYMNIPHFIVFLCVP